MHKLEFSDSVVNGGDNYERTTEVYLTEEQFKTAIKELEEKQLSGPNERLNRYSVFKRHADKIVTTKEFKNR